MVVTECWTLLYLLQSNCSSAIGAIDPGNIGPPKTEELKGKLFNVSV